MITQYKSVVCQSEIRKYAACVHLKAFDWK